jgi:hypothetical protein
MDSPSIRPVVFAAWVLHIGGVHESRLDNGDRRAAVARVRSQYITKGVHLEHSLHLYP